MIARWILSPPYSSIKDVGLAPLHICSPASSFPLSTEYLLLSEQTDQTLWKPSIRSTKTAQ